MNDPQLYLTLEKGFALLFLVPLLIVLGIDLLGRLATLRVGGLSNPGQPELLQRLQIKYRLKRSGLRQQLGAHKIKWQRYFDAHTLEQLTSQLNTCNRCEHAAHCRQLRRSPPELSACPNANFIQPLIAPV